MAAGRGTRLRPRRPTHCAAPTATRLGLRLRRGCGRGRGRGWGRGADASTHRRGVGHDAGPRSAAAALPRVHRPLVAAGRGAARRDERGTHAPRHGGGLRPAPRRVRRRRRTGVIYVRLPLVSLCCCVGLSRWHFHILRARPSAPVAPVCPRSDLHRPESSSLRVAKTRAAQLFPCSRSAVDVLPAC